MKVEIEIKKNGNGENGEEMPMKRTAFQRKVAKMIAQRAGRKNATMQDMKMAADLEEDISEYGMEK